jgi:hypothetical protein
MQGMDSLVWRWPALALAHDRGLPVPRVIAADLAGRQAGVLATVTSVLPGGCDQPASRCEPHHIRHRKDGGHTSLSGLQEWCWFHHHVVLHQMGWQLIVHPDGTSQVTSPTGKIIRSHSPPGPSLLGERYSYRGADRGSSRNRRRRRGTSVRFPLTMSFSASPTWRNATTTRTSTISGGYTCHQ